MSAVTIRPTTLKIDPDTKARIQRLADVRHRSSHWLMLEAQRAVKAIRERVKILSYQPETGRPTEEMEPEYREWLIDFGESGYIALYRFDGEKVVIVAVRHQKEVGYPPVAFSSGKAT